MENIIVVALKAIILFNGKALILQRSENDEAGANTWEFVGGKLDFGEDLTEALKREIKEEVDLDVDINELLYAVTFKTNEHRQVVILTYLCTARSDFVNISSEHKDYLWADRNQMQCLLEKPIINDLENNSIWRKLRIN